MKIKNIISLLLVFIAISCSNENDAFVPNNESLSQIQSLYEDSKELTLIHNEMLDDFHKQALSNGLKFSKPLSDEEMSLFVIHFVGIIEHPTTTRSVTWDDAIEVSQVIKINQMNDAVSNIGTLHTRSENWENVAYLEMFCEEFYNIDSEKITSENVDDLIKSILGKVTIQYPNLSSEQMEKLAFVSSLTYNSYNYWYNHAVDWYSNLKESGDLQTRGIWSDLWGAVKSGTKKWAYADSKGAVAAMAGAELLGNVVAPATALAGTAVGSTIGAIENFFN